MAVHHGRSRSSVSSQVACVALLPSASPCVLSLPLVRRLYTICESLGSFSASPTPPTPSATDPASSEKLELNAGELIHLLRLKVELT